MFTGIVEAIGQIIAVDPVVVSGSSRQEVGAETDSQGRRLTIALGNLDHEDVVIGDSIAISGACMTVIAIHDGRIQVDVSAESLRCTVGLDRCGPVNLEKAMLASDRWGGHMVSGHVDGTAEVIGLTAVGESWCIRARVPATFSALVTEKGSIALDGVSLTVNTVSDTARHGDHRKHNSAHVAGDHLAPASARRSHQCRVGSAGQAGRADCEPHGAPFIRNSRCPPVVCRTLLHSLRTCAPAAWWS